MNIQEYIEYMVARVPSDSLAAAKQVRLVLEAYMVLPEGRERIAQAMIPLDLVSLRAEEYEYFLSAIPEDERGRDVYGKLRAAIDDAKRGA